jgi:hypothetical protein
VFLMRPSVGGAHSRVEIRVPCGPDDGYEQTVAVGV